MKPRGKELWADDPLTSFHLLYGSCINLLKLCNLNGWKIVMQLNYIKCQFRPNNFFESIHWDQK